MACEYVGACHSALRSRVEVRPVWASMFAVDGTPSTDLPTTPTPGPNQLLAARMGIVMGTSHHEPMSRNQKEFNTFGHGNWNFSSNKEFLEEFWTYGAERAKGLGDGETLFTVGMRGNGDLPLDGADVPVSGVAGLSPQSTH